MAYVLHTSRKMYGVRPGTELSFPASNYGYCRDSKLQNDVLHDVIPIIFDVHLRDCFLSYFISYKNKMAKRTLRTTDEINEYLDDLQSDFDSDFSDDDSDEDSVNVEVFFSCSFVIPSPID